MVAIAQSLYGDGEGFPGGVQVASHHFRFVNNRETANNKEFDLYAGQRPLRVELQLLHTLY
jgi:hypothetical protein